MRGPISARSVFAAAAKGDQRAVEIVAAEAVLVAKAICSVVTVVDPDLIVLGGGVGRATGFVDLVRDELARIAPVLPELRVSALGDDAVVDGCLAAGADRVWEAVTAGLAPDIQLDKQVLMPSTPLSHSGRTPAGSVGSRSAVPPAGARRSPIAAPADAPAAHAVRPSGRR